MVSCTSCKKNATKKRIIYDGICNDCSISDKTNEIVSNIGVDVEDNVKDLKIRDLIKIFHGILLPQGFSFCLKALANDKKTMANLIFIDLS